MKKETHKIGSTRHLVVGVIGIRYNMDDVTDELLSVLKHGRRRHADRLQHLARERLFSDAAIRFHSQQADQLTSQAALLSVLLPVIAETREKPKLQQQT